jgi:hypothetical protein
VSPTRPRRPEDSRWARWRALSARERRETVLAAALIPLAAARLRVAGSHRILSGLGRPLASRSGVDLAAARQAARAVARAAGHAPYGGTCLSQSIALVWLLRRRGLAAHLRLGARRREGALEAHAWVEHGGVVLNDTPTVAQRFSPFGRPGGSPPGVR